MLDAFSLVQRKSFKMPVVKEFMSPTPQTIGRDANLLEAKQLLKELEIRHLLVSEGKEMIGILSDRDLPSDLSQKDLEDILVDDVMSQELFKMPADTPVVEVVEKMAERKLGSAIIVDQEKVVGIFTLIDALQLLVKMLRTPDS